MKSIQHALNCRDLYRQYSDLQRREEDISGALVAMQEWQYIQHQLLLFVRTAMQSNERRSIRQSFEICIKQCTKGRAHMRWEPCTNEVHPDTAQLVVVSFPPTRYGTLTLVPGFLVSPLLPTLPEDFASLCAQILLLLEHRALVQDQIEHLTPLHKATLSQREQETLVGLAHGYNDEALARHMGVERATAHSHRQRLYRRLDVHTAQEAVLRGFALRLFSWLDPTS